MKKICVVTGTRADYGLLRWVMKGINESIDLELRVIATGMHLSPEFGLTYREIESDGFQIDHSVEILLSSDTAVGTTKSMGLAICSFADVFSTVQPDLLLILGDRYEIFAAASAAMIACIPIAHIHGGETTEGAFDEAIRHSITKMSNLHFVGADEYRNRVIQLGENPETVFMVGGLGIDNILKLKLLSTQELEEKLKFKFGPRNLLVTFHPTTLEKNNANTHMSELLSALSTLKDTHIIFTMPNADPEGRNLINLIDEFINKYPTTTKSFFSLGQLDYLSCMQNVDGVVGNSSSGLIEAPTFKKGTINIGNRQKGRLKALSVIDCKPEKYSIIEAITKLYSLNFKNTLKKVKNPYGDGGSSEKVIEVLSNPKIKYNLKKKFYDLKNIN